LGQSLSAVYCHLVFSTKQRHPYFVDPHLRGRVHAYLGAVSNKFGCPSLTVGGTADHVHLLARLSKTVTQSDWVREVKSRSSYWLTNKEPQVRDFAWQGGYAVFAVSVGGLDAVRRYIETQEEHHRKVSFQEEFLRLLEEHDLEWNEQFVWD